MTTPIPELKPCPFCGGEASSSGVINYHEKHEAWFIDGMRITQAFYCNCMSCTTSNRGMLGHQTREKAITAWNTRAAIEAATEQGKRQPLTDEELDLMSEKALFCRISRQQFARSIEAAHGIHPAGKDAG